MSREQLSFVVGDGAVVEVATHAGDIGIDIEPGDTVIADLDTGERGYEVSQVGSRITIAPRPGRFRRFGGGDINLTVPPGTDLIARTTSGDLRTGSVRPRDASLGHVEVATASGDLRLENIEGDLRAKTASGDVFAGQVSGSLTAATASGDVRVDAVAGDAEITTASGDAFVDGVDGTVEFRNASGDVTIRRVAGPSVRGKSLSGDVRLGIPPRREIQLDLTSLAGDLHHDLTPSGLEPVAHLRIELSLVSGDVFLYDA